MSPEDRLDYAIMSLEQRPVASQAAIGAIRAVQGDIARLRADLAAIEHLAHRLQGELAETKRALALTRGSLILAREELSRRGLVGHFGE